MQEKLKQKLQEREGFTLVELLIVVAIIAILVAVSIPVYSGYLNGVKSGVDQANERDAMALANAASLTGKQGDAANTDITYDAASGQATAVYQVDSSKQGKLVFGTAPTTGIDYGQCTDHEKGYIKVTLTKNGAPKVEWVVGGTPVTDTKNHNK